MRVSANLKLEEITKKKKFIIMEQQLSDFEYISQILNEKLEKGGKKEGFDKLAILGQNNDGSIILTMKKLFINSIEQSKFPINYNDLKVIIKLLI